MKNEIKKINGNQIDLPKDKNDLLNAKEIYAFVRNINPQFYNNKTKGEIESEIRTMQYLISDIPQEVLCKMCELAVKKYPKKKIEDEKLVFNLNYILTFFAEADFIIANDITSLEDLWTDIDTLDVVGVGNDEKSN